MNTIYPFFQVQLRTLAMGNGYWLRFESAGTTSVNGQPVGSLSISLVEGWNLISGISSSIDMSDIIDVDNLIIPNTLFGFSADGYWSPESLTPGKGYWLRSSGNGEITLTSGNRSAKGKQEFIDRMVGANTITFNGKSLYFGVIIPDDEKLSYSLPPKPPVGAFDVRFTNDMNYAESFGEIEVNGIGDILKIEFDIKSNTGENMNWELISENGEKYVLDGQGEIIINKNTTTFTLAKLSEVPTVFSLSQNYPNPFNPITTINYQLPKESFVTMSIYNLLGQKITDLVSEAKGEGYHSFLWNGTNDFGESVASGVYIYSISTDEFHCFKKLVLMI